MLLDRAKIPAFCCALGTALLVSLSGMMNAQPSRRPAARAVRPASLTGEQVYRQQCAACHGVKGEGTKQYRKELIGTQSVGQLASFISKSMPPGPKKCSVADAKKVAAYIHDAFYSPVAQARNRPPRVELARLTAKQYRNAVADLIGSFRKKSGIDARRGLQGAYYKTTKRRRAQAILERVDPEIKFDFGTTGALPEQDDPYQFTMEWEGALLPPETGEYEFLVRTEHAVQLWVNDPQKPLIDALVKSGSDDEYRATLFLIGGYAYPLRLEFSKGVQGVNDLKELKKKPPQKATLTLEWRAPKREREVIPQRCLSPVSVSEVFAAASPFPPDDRSMGYERGTSVSKAWDEATTEAALETAGYVAEHLAELSGAGDSSEDREAKIRAFCKAFVGRAFRRPLTEELERVYVERQFKAAPNLEVAVKRVALLALKSPRFLYREVGSSKPDAYDVAARLSFGLWDSLPDETLLQAAANNALSTREQVIAQAERMIADPRAWTKLRDFLLQWLKVDNYPELAKNTKRYPDFDAQVQADLRTAMELFLEQVVWNEKSDFRELLLTNKLFLNGRLAKVYGANLPPDAPFQWVEAKERAGVLTHPYLLASFAYLDASSPIHRGVLLARNLLGRVLQPPQQAFTPLAADLHPKLTTRERVALQTKPSNCMTCHGMINPLGFTLERFDAIGRVRAEENGKKIDDSGSYQSRSGKVIPFSGARDLAQFLAGSEEAHQAFVERLFHHLVKQPVRAYGSQTLPELERAFKKKEFNIRKEMVEIMAATALKGSSQVADASPPTKEKAAKPTPEKAGG